MQILFNIIFLISLAAFVYFLIKQKNDKPDTRKTLMELEDHLNDQERDVFIDEMFAPRMKKEGD